MHYIRPLLLPTQLAAFRIGSRALVVQSHCHLLPVKAHLQLLPLDSLAPLTLRKNAPKTANENTIIILYNKALI